jgi:CcmD family protein
MPESAQAAQPSTESVADRKSEFVPVGPGGETSSAEALLIVAYMLMWALIFGLVFLSQRRQRQIDARLTELEATLKKLDQADAARES